MAGIDGYSANGSTAFDSSSKLCDELSSYHVPVDEIPMSHKPIEKSRLTDVMNESLVTTLECLPHEIFLAIFSYLDGYSIYQSFYELNNRLSGLVRSTMGKYLDLREIKRHKCQQVLASIDQSQVTGLLLSNKYDDELADRLLTCSFHGLRYLTLDCVGVFTVSDIIYNKLMPNYLESLSICFRSDQCHEKVYGLSMGILKICSRDLKSLRFLNLCTDFNQEMVNRNARIKNQIDNDLSCQCFHLTTICLNNLHWILSHLPYLRSLTFIATLNTWTDSYPPLPHLHTCIATFIKTDFDLVKRFLGTYSNLQRLELALTYVQPNSIDDYQWQSIIEQSLPKLKQFTLEMSTNALEKSVAERLCTVSFERDSFWQKRNTIVTIWRKNVLTNQTIEVDIQIEFGYTKAIVISEMASSDN
ncbi:unnamed protein product [Rotaria socialis]|uniref:F-box domain-containing protein n=2 Tax=Rotaria socialis TaxID=392032 RepID=A0A821BWY3_9BILA|nr:unnamed protein product [Rotaria socialis]